MRRPILLALLAAACACGSSSTTPVGPPPIADGARLSFSLVDGSPDAAAQVMRKRLALARIKGWASAQGDAIVVDLADADPAEMEAARELIARTARFQVRLVDSDDAVMRRIAQAAERDPSAQAAGISVADDAWQTSDGTAFADVYLRAADREDVVDVETARRLGCLYGPRIGADQVRCPVTGRAALEQYLGAAAQIDPSLKLPDDRALAFERVTPTDPDGLDRRPYWRTYYVARAPTLSNQDVAGAKPIVDPNGDRPAVGLALRPDAATALADLTRGLVGHKLAFVLDDRVEGAPIVMGALSGGQLTLRLPADARPGDARALAIALSSGPLPGPVILESVARLQGGQVIADPDP